MAEFKRSRLARRNEETVTKKTVFMGFLTILVIILVILFGLPLLVKFSVFLGNTKKNDSLEEKAVPPLAPRLILPYEATNSANISINGFSESGVEVELYKNEISIGKTQVTENGDFVFKDITLEEGDNSFSAIANSKNAGSSDGSIPMLISYDNKIPELKLTNPTEKELTVDYADFDIIGETEKGVNVTINGKLAVVDDSGKFKLKMQLNMGKNELEVVARDIAGNESKSKVTITYSL